MKNILFVSLVLYTLFVVGLATLNGPLLALTLPLIVYLGMAFLSRPTALNVTIVREMQADRISENEPVPITLTLTNRGENIAELLVEDLLPGTLRVLEGRHQTLVPLPPNAVIELKYSVTGTRGLHQISGVRLTAGEHFGLFKKEEMIEAPDEILILPQITRLRRVEIRPRQTRVYSGPIPTRQGGSGVEFFGVREYQPGDPLRWINSRASARHTNALFINEFQQERVADVGLILDAREQADVVSTEGSLFEHDVRASAALADAFLNAGNRVGLFIYGRTLDWTFPGYGKVQREKIFRALAGARLGGGQVFEKLEHLPTRLFPARSQLVFISPLLPQDMEELVKLYAYGYRVLVVSPNPVEFERKRLSESEEVRMGIRIARLEREVLLNQLRHTGIQVMDWQVDTPFQQAAHIALSRVPHI